MKFNIITLGCKVNTYESETMSELLLKNGFFYEEEFKNADIVIINTCSVTNMADIKSKKIIRRVKRENPDSILVVCGCSSQNHQNDYKNMGIDILLGNIKKSEIVNLINNYIKTKEPYFYFDSNRNLNFEAFKVEKFTNQTRAFIKIQDGCNNFCSYCIIPYVRGDIRSKDFEAVINEAIILSNNGHQEIVLTGIHTGSYNSNGKDLADLIMELAKIEKLKRIRVSSIEITELNDKFLDVLKNEPKLCNHLHIPLQAGSDEILRRMNRKYDKSYFKMKIDKIRSIREDISITTDVIVGHPYENEELFLECYEFCKSMNFSKIHVFPYSKREGTASASMPMQVDEFEKKNRARKLIELSNNLENKYYNNFVNCEMDILTEEIYDHESVGHSDNYIKVLVKEKLLPNKFYQIKICDVKDNIAIGKIKK